MADKQEEMLDKIREQVLQREKEIQFKQDKENSLEATLQALEEVTEVPRDEMVRIANEIRASYEEDPGAVKTDPSCLHLVKQAQLPATVREAVSSLPPVLQDEFYEEYALVEKRVGLSYLFLLIPPPLSCHYLYNNRIFLQILYTLTFGGALMWWLVDFKRIRQIVQDENRKTARKLLKKMMKQSIRRQRRKLLNP